MAGERARAWVGGVVAAVAVACASTPAQGPQVPETPRVLESQEAWESALQARFDVVRERSRRCYDAFLAEVERRAVAGAYLETAPPPLSGRIELEVEVGADGALRVAGWALDELRDGALRACVDREVGRVTLPPPPDATPVAVTVPLVFQVGAAAP